NPFPGVGLNCYVPAPENTPTPAARSRPLPLYIAGILLPLIAIVHLLRTGRDMRWLFLIIFLPMVGALAYLIVEVLQPWLTGSRGARRAFARARATIDPHRGVREGALEYERSQNVDNASRLAAELTKAQRFDEAIRVCNDARTGLFEDDP